MIYILNKILKKSAFFWGSVTVISSSMLLFAHYMQTVMLLDPCNICIIQRMITIFIAVYSFIMFFCAISGDRLGAVSNWVSTSCLYLISVTVGLGYGFYHKMVQYGIVELADSCEIEDSSETFDMVAMLKGTPEVSFLEAYDSCDKINYLFGVISVSTSTIIIFSLLFLIGALRVYKIK